MKMLAFLKRHFFLLAIFLLLAAESVCHIIYSYSGFWTLRAEVFLAIGILVVYYFTMHSQRKRPNEEEFRVLVDRIHCGMAIIRMDDGFTLQRANPAFFKIAGYTPGEIKEKFHNKTIRLVQNEDLPYVMENISKLTVNKIHGHIDFRIVDKSGKTKWIHMDTFLFHQDGRHPVFQCIFTDITKLKSSIEQAEMEAKRFQIICELSNNILFDYDIETGTMTTTQPISDLYEKETEIPHFYQNVEESHAIYPYDLPALYQFLANAMGQEILETELRILYNGCYVWFRLEGLVLKNASQKPIRIIGKFTNIDHIKRENEHLQKELQRDPMTGVYNKVATEHLIDRYLQGAGEDNVSALFVLDVDNFKYINDTFGHLTGDAILTNIVREIKNVLRSSDIFGRIGGDEFVIFVKNIRSREVARTKAKRLCRVFRTISLMDDFPCVVSGSIGIAIFPADGQSYHKLFSNADSALYIAKGQGKDGFAFHGDSVTTLLNAAEQRLSSQAAPLYISEYGIIENVVTYLGEHCTEPNVMEETLSIVGQYYQAKRANLLKFSASDETIEQVYSWSEPGCRCDATLFKQHPATYWQEYVARFDQNSVFQGDSLITENKPTKFSSLQHVAFSQQRPTSILMFDLDGAQSPLKLHEVQTLSLIHGFLHNHMLMIYKLQALRELSNIDALTGALTYESFRTVFDQIFAADLDKRYALISCDINRFSEINDLLGRNDANQILIAFASAIHDQLQQGEYIGRVAADIFSVLVFFENEKELRARAESWFQTFNEHIKPYNLMTAVKVACGICVIQKEKDTTAAMFDRSNAARKLAKQEHAKGIKFYDQQMLENMLLEKELETYKYSAIDNQEFIINLQPQYDLVDCKIIGAEALVRWNHPTLGRISPAAFIPVFEKDHFIIELDFYVTEAVCRLLRKWMDEGQPVVPIAVNFSRVHLLTNDFISRLLQIVNKYNIPPSLLELELTESAYISHMRDVLKIAQELRGHGFLMAMDDFGAGYSSLNLLKSMEFDILKLDKNYFQEKEPTPKETIIVENIVRLAKQLDLRVVCEGVEREWQAEFLCGIDCDFVQGYFFSRPVPVHRFEEMLREFSD